MRTLEELTRPNVWRLKPYSSARDEYNGAAASVFLDAKCLLIRYFGYCLAIIDAVFSI